VEVSQASLSGIPILRVVGDADHQAAAAFAEAVRNALDPDRDCLLLDLSDCPYLDSGGLGVILTVYRDMRERGWVGVVGPSLNVRRLLELVGLLGEDSFLVFGNEEEAATHVSAPRLDGYSASSN
jgi:stage II sporulation protein AA (anti-sigma F factor antagonist)